jgi:hypothetical protein
MEWFRSWPAVPPVDRARVIDAIPRLVMTDCDYATLNPGWPASRPGFCMLEWDVALDRVGRARFAALAADAPGQVLVADYPIYPIGGPPAGTCRARGRPIAPGTPTAETFGFGCIYFPADVLAAWPGGRLTDRTFSRWHLTRYGLARVAPGVHPQHLHGD